ncbi:MAG: SAM-dependent methyltransferase, partial [Spirochaetaceae bacterium]
MTGTTRQYGETATATAQRYYNSTDADSFYYTIWGGEDIHIGLYQDPGEDIGVASRRTVEQMRRLVDPGPDSKVLDVGAGYGGAARALARETGCSVVALNLSEVENERDREKNREAGLEKLIQVVDASFEDIPFENGTFDIVWSQDAMLHSGRRTRVLEEVARVLKRGGQLVFTDPMRTDECPEGVLDPILERLHLDDLAHPAFYRETLATLGFREERF